MRRVRFWAIALIGLLFVVGESFLRKAIAVSLCGILGFNSTLCYSNLAKSADGAVMANPQSWKMAPSNYLEGARFKAIPPTT